jgi:hypothetical protein
MRHESFFLISVTFVVMPSVSTDQCYSFSRGRKALSRGKLWWLRRFRNGLIGVGMPVSWRLKSGHQQQFQE